MLSSKVPTNPQMRRFELSPDYCLHIGDDIKLYIGVKPEAFLMTNQIKLVFDVSRHIDIRRPDALRQKPRR
jgi:hypothetical protein